MKTKASESFKIGTAVYRVGAPKSPGKVIGAREEGAVSQVLWLTGEESWTPTKQLRSLQSLIDEHKRKIEEHKDALTKLETL